jgi:predicted lipoprotein with Yx(FWY)xxD motif
MRIKIGTRGRAAVVVASVMLAAACGSSAGASSQKPSSVHTPSGVVGTAQNATLGTSVLVNHSGMTLYSLSAERNERFICTNSACLKLWTPLLVHGTVKATGIGSLGTIQRPNGGGMQLTYRGLPLYTFTGDHSAGDAAGNGFKDVGTWRAATLSGTAPTAPASTSSTSGGYGY